jgi:hypothetical protein
MVDPPTPPPGRIVTTEEVVVEYEYEGRVGERQGLGRGHGAGSGEAV